MTGVEWLEGKLFSFRGEVASQVTSHGLNGPIRYRKNARESETCASVPCSGKKNIIVGVCIEAHDVPLEVFEIAVYSLLLSAAFLMRGR